MKVRSSDWRRKIVGQISTSLRTHNHIRYDANKVFIQWSTFKWKSVSLEWDAKVMGRCAKKLAIIGLFFEENPWKFKLSQRTFLAFKSPFEKISLKLRKVSTPSKQWNLPHEPSCRWSIHSVVPSVPTDRSKIKDTTTYAHFPQHYNEGGICGDLRAIRHSSWRFYNLFQWYFDYFWRQHYSNHKHTKCDK